MNARSIPVRASLILGLLVWSLCGAGCSDPRRWDGCAIAGALIGAATGATIGIVVADHNDTHRKHQARDIGGGSGAGLGAILGAVAGHYICDPLFEKPPEVQVAEAPPPPPPVAPAPVIPAAPPERIVLRGVHFDFDKAELQPESLVILDQAAQSLNRHSGIAVTIDGYCDIIGGEDYNLELSRRRAQAVAEYLQGKGVPTTRMLTRGFGKTHFVATNETDAGRAENRRVEILPMGREPSA